LSTQAADVLTIGRLYLGTSRETLLQSIVAKSRLSQRRVSYIHSTAIVTFLAFCWNNFDRVLWGRFYVRSRNDVVRSWWWC